MVASIQSSHGDIELGGKQERYLMLPRSVRPDWRPVWLNQLTTSCNPYTQEDERVFLIAKQHLERTNKWLGWRGYCMITFGVGSLVFLSSRTIAYSEDEQKDAIIAASFGLAATLLSNICSMLFTGTFPHISSNTQNADQNILKQMKQRFSALAKYLLIQHAEGNKEIVPYVTKIDIERISGAISKMTTQAEEMAYVVGFLADTLKYIQSLESGLPITSHNSELECLIVQLRLPLR